MALTLRLRFTSSAERVESVRFDRSATVATVLQQFPSHELLLRLSAMVHVPATGVRFPISFRLEDTVQDAKLQIEARTQLPARHQQLLIHESELGPECKLRDVLKPVEHGTLELRLINESEAQASEFYRDTLPEIAATGRRNETFALTDTLADLGLVDGQELYLVPRMKKLVQVNLLGKAHSLEITEGMRVGDLKKEIAINHHIPGRIRLVFCGRTLNDDDKLLEEYGIMSDSVVTVLPRPDLKADTPVRLETAEATTHPEIKTNAMDAPAFKVSRIAILGFVVTIAAVLWRMRSSNVRS